MGTNEYSQKFKMDKKKEIKVLGYTLRVPGGCVPTRDVLGLKKSDSRLPFPLHPFIILIL